MPTPSTFGLPSVNLEKVNTVNLPSNILNMLEGKALRSPSFPDVNADEDLRIVAGGASSSRIIRNNFDSLTDTLQSLSTQNTILENIYKANKVSLEGLYAMQSCLSTILTSLNSITGTAVLLDFYQNSSAILSTSTCNVDTFYGQATLKYLSAPYSHVLRPDRMQARPGTVIQYAKIPSSQLTLSSTEFNDSDGTAFNALDGKLDTAWSVPVDTNEDLLVNIKLTPTLGRDSKVNAIGIAPWPSFGTSIIEVYVRTNESTYNSGWRKISLKGQLSYNSSTDSIETAGAHRLFFGGVAATEFLIRLRSKSTVNLGLVLFDAWTVSFDTSSKLDVNMSSLGITVLGGVVLGGTDPDALARIIPTILGSQLTLNLTSGSIYDSPVLTSLGLKANTDSTGLTGFDISVFQP